MPDRLKQEPVLAGCPTRSSSSQLHALPIYAVAPNSGKTSCSAKVTTLLGFLRAAGSGLRNASVNLGIK